MKKIINLNSTIYDLIQENPELLEIMKGLGFTEISKPAMLNSMGRVMTLPKGSKLKKIPMEKILETLEDTGFIVEGLKEENKTENVTLENPKPESDQVHTPSTRTEQIKSYLKRLGDGEDLETVRSDFVKDFENVEASEIMRAEQEIMAEGTPLKEVQRLCDIHSALFHGATQAEKIAQADLAVAESLKKEAEQKEKQLVEIPGHPLNTLYRENQNLEKLIKIAEDALEEEQDLTETLDQIQSVTVHYKKKGDLLYPHLKVKYDISGPHQVMWTVDNEIRDELNKLIRSEVRGQEWKDRLRAVLTRMSEMIYKENNILFPILTENFTEDEWKGVYFDSMDYSPSLGVEDTVWEEIDSIHPHKVSEDTDEVVIPGGHLTLEQLEGLMRTLPIEVTFIDDQDINRYFNEGPKVFKRPLMALDREVYSCHPPKVEPMVRKIIDDFKNNRRDSFPIWMEREGKPFMVNYVAVRDHDGKYIGTAEFVQDMSLAQEHFNSLAKK